MSVFAASRSEDRRPHEEIAPGPHATATAAASRRLSASGRRMSTCALIAAAFSWLSCPVVRAETAHASADTFTSQAQEIVSEMSRRPTEIWSVLEDGHRITFALADDHTVRLRVAAGAEHQRDVSYAVVPRNWSKPAAPRRRSASRSQASGARCISSGRSTPTTRASAPRRWISPGRRSPRPTNSAPTRS